MANHETIICDYEGCKNLCAYRINGINLCGQHFAGTWPKCPPKHHFAVIAYREDYGPYSSSFGTLFSDNINDAANYIAYVMVKDDTFSNISPRGHKFTVLIDGRPKELVSSIEENELFLLFDMLQSKVDAAYYQERVQNQ